MLENCFQIKIDFDFVSVRFQFVIIVVVQVFSFKSFQIEKRVFKTSVNPIF